MCLVSCHCNNTTQGMIWISMADSYAWKCQNLIHCDRDLTSYYSMSWDESQEFCQDIFGTNLSPPTDTNIEILKSILEEDMKSYVGLIKDLENTNEANEGGANWVMLDGSECPSHHVDIKYGNRICYDEDKWDDNEPNNAYNLEHCSEMRSNGKLNDIICFDIAEFSKYGWIQGFPCDEPDDYFVDAERTIITPKYVLNTSFIYEAPMNNTGSNDDELVRNRTSVTNEPLMTIDFADDEPNVGMKYDASNFHVGSVGDMDLFLKDLIIFGLFLLLLGFMIVSAIISKRKKRKVYELEQRIFEMQHGRNSVSSSTKTDTKDTCSNTESSRYSHNESHEQDLDCVVMS